MMGRTSDVKCLGIPLFLVDAEFEIHAVEKLLFRRMRFYKQPAKLEAVVRRPSFLEKLYSGR